MSRSFLMLATLLWVISSTVAWADDWPQWMGPQRDNVWREKGIVSAFPEDGLKVLWRTPIHGGYGGPAVAQDRVVVLDYVRSAGDAENNPDKRNELQGKERVVCLSAEIGEILWVHEYDRPYQISYPAGPRCTPTIDGNLVFSLGAEGDLRCLDLQSGKLHWAHDFQKDYHVTIPIWGCAGHPLVYGDLLICMVGGEGSIVVAFNKKDGKEVWRALSAKEIGYCPPSIIHSAGIDQLIIWDTDQLNSLNPLTGSVYWSQPLIAAYGMAVHTPQLSGNDLFASAIGPTGGLYELDQEKPGIKVKWLGTTKTGVSCANCTPILRNGVIYGADCRSGGLRAVDMTDGKWLWETYRPTTGNHRAGHGNTFIVSHDDRVFLFSETGDLILARLSREEYKELGRFHLLEPTGEAFGRSVVWSAPAFARQCVFARNDKEIVCASLKAPATDTE